MHQGRKIKQLREERGWTQQELRSQLKAATGRDISRPAISLVESREWLDSELLTRLAETLGVNPAMFFDVRIAPQKESREQAIKRAFDYVRQDASIPTSPSRVRIWPEEAKLYAIRLYEKFTGRNLLPEDIG